MVRGGCEVAKTSSCRCVRQQRHALIYGTVGHFHFQSVCETSIYVYFCQTLFRRSGLCRWVTTGLTRSWSYFLFSRRCHLRTIWVVGPYSHLLRLDLRGWDEACLFRFVPLQGSFFVVSGSASWFRFYGGQHLRGLQVSDYFRKRLGCTGNSAQVFLLKEHICLPISFFCQSTIFLSELFFLQWCLRLYLSFCNFGQVKNKRLFLNLNISKGIGFLSRFELLNRG